MRAFADLLERLAFTPSRNAKLQLLQHYLERTPDPDRGYAFAALTGDLKLRTVTPSLLRGLAVERFDDELFALSYDFVGGLAETIALIWDGEPQGELSVSAAVHLLETTGKAGLPAAIARVLDRTDSIASMFNHASRDTRGDWDGAFRRISQPALIIHGSDDPILPPANGQALAAGIGSATLDILPGVGHELPVGVHGRITDLIAAHVSRANSR